MQMSLLYLHWSRGDGRRPTHSTCPSERLRCLSRTWVVSGVCLLPERRWQVCSTETSRSSSPTCWEMGWWSGGRPRMGTSSRRMTSVYHTCGSGSGNIYFIKLIIWCLFFAIFTKLVRIYSGALDADADAETVDRWTRAYIMEMFACWMFPDSSGATVPGCLLEWLRDLAQPKQMNWGAAVLACLYRSLCTACQV